MTFYLAEFIVVFTVWMHSMLNGLFLIKKDSTMSKNNSGGSKGDHGWGRGGMEAEVHPLPVEMPRKMQAR